MNIRRISDVSFCVLCLPISSAFGSLKYRNILLNNIIAVLYIFLNSGVSPIFLPALIRTVITGCSVANLYDFDASSVLDDRYVNNIYKQNTAIENILLRSNNFISRFILEL
jgi:hypothetical protein